MGGSRALRHPPKLGLYVVLVIRHLMRYISMGIKEKKGDWLKHIINSVFESRGQEDSRRWV